jgi:hypothetical protein
LAANSAGQQFSSAKSAASKLIAPSAPPAYFCLSVCAWPLCCCCYLLPAILAIRPTCAIIELTIRFPQSVNECHWHLLLPFPAYPNHSRIYPAE